MCCLYKIILRTSSGKLLCKAESGEVRMGEAGRGEGKGGGEGRGGGGGGGEGHLRHWLCTLHY